MASAIAEALIPALLELEADTGAPTATWNTVVMPCVPSTLRRGTVIILGGEEVEIQLTLIIRKSLFTGDQPGAGKLIIHRAKTYRILGVGDAPGGSHYEIDCGDPNK